VVDRQIWFRNNPSETIVKRYSVSVVIRRIYGNTKAHCGFQVKSQPTKRIVIFFSMVMTLVKE
jgi:hypothetical protein